MEWVLTILPVAMSFVAIAWCMLYVRRLGIREEEASRHRRRAQQQQQEQEKEDPVDFQSRRAFIESKLVTRMVLTSVNDGSIVFSKPLTKEGMEEEHASCRSCEMVPNHELECDKGDDKEHALSDNNDEDEEILPFLPLLYPDDEPGHEQDDGKRSEVEVALSHLLRKR